MFVNGWVVLFVDDEPDVLTVSRMAMRKFSVYGVPLRIYTARSKAAAQELLTTQLATQEGTNSLSVALIDVVMETDQAGLELCQFIREEQKNHISQLYIRTGQLGVAPERQVIDRYDINGYFTKVEATEDKLYSLIKSGIRQHYALVTSLVLSDVLQAVIANAGSRQKIAGVLNYMMVAIQTDATGGVSAVTHGIRLAIIADGKLIASHVGADPAKMLALRDRLELFPSTTLSPDGDQHVSDGNDFLFKIPARPINCELYMVVLGRIPRQTSSIPSGTDLGGRSPCSGSKPNKT